MTSWRLISTIVMRIAVLVAFAAPLFFSSCVHEFPIAKPDEPVLVDSVEISLSLTSISLELYTNIEINTDVSLKSTRNSVAAQYSTSQIGRLSIIDEEQMRYVIGVYPISSNGTVQRTAAARVELLADPETKQAKDTSITISEGLYRFIVWADYPVSGTTNDQFYSTSDFSKITFNGEYQGSTDLKDAFYGYADYEILAGQDNVIEIVASRPMGKFTVISTDLADFINKVIRMDALSSVDTKSVDIADYTILFAYNGFLPSTYSLFTGTLVDSATGISFTSIPENTEDGVVLGFDYVLVPIDSETTISLALGVYNKDGTLISSVSSVEVPIVANGHTIIEGRFLSSDSNSSVGINNQFTGDYNIEI